MSKIQSSAEHLTLNADGSGNDIKFQSNGSEVASISDGGVVTATSFAGSGANLTNIPATDISGKLSLSGGTMTGNLAVNGGAVFNEASADVDFRIESNAYDHAFMLQGSDGFVGLGINVPLDLLHLRGGSDNSSTGAPIIRMQKQSGGAVDDGQTIGGMSFWVNDDGVDSGASKERAKIIAESQNTSSGTRLEFWTGNSNAAIAERMRIQADGKVGINGSPDCMFTIRYNGWTQANGVSLYDSYSGSQTNNFLLFYRNGNQVGSITNTLSATAFNTSSDYRLKENVDYTWDATTRLKQLKPARFNFIVDDTNTLVDGFLAHEVSSIVPEAVTGEKDAEEMQGIDQSKLVPLLVKTIQEMEARITALEG